MEIMGDRIKQLRKERGMTQEEVGKIIGVQKSAIRKYESGLVQNMKRSSIKKLSDFFGVSPSYLLGYDEKEPPTVTEDGEQLAEFINLFSRLSPEQRASVLALLRSFAGSKQ